MQGSAVFYTLYDEKRMLHISAMPREASSIRYMRGNLRKSCLVYDICAAMCVNRV